MPSKSPQSRFSPTQNSSIIIDSDAVQKRVLCFMVSWHLLRVHFLSLSPFPNIWHFKMASKRAWRRKFVIFILLTLAQWNFTLWCEITANGGVMTGGGSATHYTVAERREKSERRLTKIHYKSFMTSFFDEIYYIFVLSPPKWWFRYMKITS